MMMSYLLVSSVLSLLGLALQLLAAPDGRHLKDRDQGMALWIDEKQVKEFSGDAIVLSEIFAISKGEVSPYILDPNFEKYLPIIPPEVVSVNFTWKSGSEHKYFYDFYQLESFNQEVLSNPVISIESKGKVPKRPRVFQVLLPCLGNRSGIAGFAIGLKIENEKGKRLPGTPLELRLQKQCAQHGPDPECDKKCANGGWCNQHSKCECPKGYIGKYCSSALCYPDCMNGGTCVSPGVCSCPDGYQGPHCEGGICSEKCLNRGKCIQKDSCDCKRGYYGKRCQYSYCTIPCLNEGTCVGINRCKCRKSYTGAQCERRIEMGTEIPVIGHIDGCRKKCKHGRCIAKQCVCELGWYGKRCNRRR